MGNATKKGDLLALSSRMLKLAGIIEVNNHKNVGIEGDLRQIEQESATFASMNLNKLSNDKLRKAFWINIYNAYTKYLIVSRKINRTLLHKPWIFFLPKINIGGHKFSLDDIEHGILRINTRPHYKILPPFMPWDSRRNYMVKKTGLPNPFCTQLWC